MTQTTENAAAFTQQLKMAGLEYHAMEPVTDQRARIRFCGPFGGKDTIRDATVYAQGRLATCRQYIEIAERGRPVRSISIGLNMDIDHAVQLRTIIMTRKYKRLHTCRHESG